MEALHQNYVNCVNGDNGRNGGDEFLQEPQPSTSGGSLLEEPPVLSLRDLCIRGLSVCRHMLYRLARRFGSQGLGQRSLDPVYCALTYGERIIAWANVAASESQSCKWDILMPIKILLIAASTVSELVVKYLDITLPENQDLVRGLHDLRTTLGALQEDASNIPGPDIYPELPEGDPSSVGAVLSPSSSVSSLSVMEGDSPEEEPPQPETPGDKSIYFSVEQLTEEEEMEVDVEDDKRGKEEEKSEEGKVEEERPATAAEYTGGAAKSMEQPQPEAQPQPQAPAPADCLVSAEEAEWAAMDALPKPSAQPTTSQDLLAAEGSSRAKPDTRKTALRATSKRTKTIVFRRSKKL